MTPKVKIYSTSWCAYCKQERSFLDEHGIPYESVDVEADPKELEEMIRVSQQQGVPVTTLTAEDGSQKTVVGFDQAWLERELKLA